MTVHSNKIGELFFLLHPGVIEFSGYGLTVEAGSHKRLVGLLMIDRPQRASRTWLAKVERTFGRYELHPMTQRGERGMACQMWIADDSLPHVRQLTGTFTRTLQTALFPLLLTRPKPQFLVTWDAQTRLWRSAFYQPPAAEENTASATTMPMPRFALGQIVATPGALDALHAAGQLPHEFLARHVVGDWGVVDEQDRQANEEALRFGERLLSAYTTKQGVKIWIISEADRSVTTILTPAEY